jgi:hypothetical protein
VGHVAPDRPAHSRTLTTGGSQVRQQRRHELVPWSRRSAAVGNSPRPELLPATLRHARTADQDRQEKLDRLTAGICGAIDPGLDAVHLHNDRKAWPPRCGRSTPRPPSCRRAGAGHLRKVRPGREVPGESAGLARRLGTVRSILVVPTGGAEAHTPHEIVKIALLCRVQITL